MTDQQAQSQVPGGTGAASASSDELQSRLTKLQDDLKAKDKEAKANQTRADKAEASLLRASGRAAQVQASGVGEQGQAGLEQRSPARPVLPTRNLPQAPNANQVLAAELEATQKELLLMRETLRRGLNPEDVEDLEFDTAAELRTQLDLIQQKREIAELKQQLEERKAGGTGTETPGGQQAAPLIDAGGRTVPGANDRKTKADARRTQAKDLKTKGMFQEATWVALRAAHGDPTKAMRVRPQDLED